MRQNADEQKLARLMDVGRSLVSELDSNKVLLRVLDTARELTGARYAALGVLDSEGTELDRFLVSGIDDDARKRIGELPRGRGILGVLIDEPRPLRLADVMVDPRSFGFPAGHPPMHTFLGVPIAVRGTVWGNLYLCEKDGGDFGAEDEETAVVLADWAAVAIDNARLFEVSERRRAELELAVRGLQATGDVAVSAGSELDPRSVADVIAERARTLVDARVVLVLLRESGRLVARASAGEASSLGGADVDESRLNADALNDGANLRPGAMEALPGESTVVVPMHFRGERIGLIVAAGRAGRGDFAGSDLRMLRVFAASAANAVELAHSVRDDRLRTAQAAAEAERARWARELHDETLQGLAALRVQLATALRRADEGAVDGAARNALDHIDHEIENLRGIISDLRPATLDELGLSDALAALLERRRQRSGLRIDAHIALDNGERPLRPETELVAYRVVQEALTNVIRHAAASRASVDVARTAGELAIRVVDDGGGFEPENVRSGFGIAGMRERSELAGGRLHVESSDRGTRVSVTLPAGMPLTRGVRHDRQTQKPKRGIGERGATRSSIAPASCSRTSS